MKTVTDLMRIVALAAFSAVCVILSIEAVHVSNSLNGVTAKVNANLDESHKALTELDGPGGSIQLLNKDLVDVKSLIVHLDMTANDAQKASKAEIASLQSWNADISRSLGEFDGVLVSLKGTSDGLNLSQAQIAAQSVATLKQAQTSIAELQPTILATRQTILDADKLIADPAIPASLANVNHITTNGMKMSDDAQHWLHEYLFPGPWKRFFGYVENGASVAVKVFVP